MHETKRHIHSVRYAIEGIYYAFNNHRNFKLHFLLSILLLSMVVLFSASSLEIAIFLLAIILSWVIELVNTAIELLIDLVSPQWQEVAKMAKDVSAGAVLTAALGEIIVAFFIALPHVGELHQRLL